MQNRNCSKEILTIIITLPYMTTSFTTIHFFYDSVIISREHFKQSTCQGNCIYFTILFATIHHNKRCAVDSRKLWILSLFEENHCSPAVLKVPIYSTELVAIIFFFKSTVLNAQNHLQRPILSWQTSIANFLGGSVLKLDLSVVHFF